MALQYIEDPSLPELKFVSICPGIQFAIVRITSDHWPYVSFKRGDDFLLINYCREGRCEVELDDNSNICLTPDDFCLCTARRVIRPFYFPTDSYTGIEISVDLSLFRDGTYSILGSSLDSISNIPEKFLLDERTYVSRASTEVRNIMTDLFSSALCDDLLFLKTQLVHLLLTFATKDRMSDSYLRTAYPKSRGKIAKEVAAIVNEDLSKHIPISELSDRFGVSESTLKNVFRSVYGQNYSDYVRSLRIKASMTELEFSDKSISDIAASVGYENQGKFASAFKKVNGITPLQYRHLHSQK